MCVWGEFVQVWEPKPGSLLFAFSLTHRSMQSCWFPLPPPWLRLYPSLALSSIPLPCPASYFLLSSTVCRNLCDGWSTTSAAAPTAFWAMRRVGMHKSGHGKAVLFLRPHLLIACPPAAFSAFRWVWARLRRASAHSSVCGGSTASPGPSCWWRPSRPWATGRGRSRPGRTW